MVYATPGTSEEQPATQPATVEHMYHTSGEKASLRMDSCAAPKGERIIAKLRCIAPLGLPRMPLAHKWEMDDLVRKLRPAICLLNDTRCLVVDSSTVSPACAIMPFSTSARGQQPVHTDWPDRLASEQYCYLTTTGRRTGQPHTIEIWFGIRDGRLFMLSGNRDQSDWVRNLRLNPAVQVRVGNETRAGTARVIEDPEEDALIRRLLAAKYQSWREGDQLSTWAQTALPVAVDFPASGTDPPP